MFEYGVMYRSASQDGIDARLLKELARRSGCEMVEVVMPRNRIWAELQSGSLDLATSAIPTAERKTYGYLLPYFQTRNVVLLDKASTAQIRTMADFEASNLRLGVVRGFRHEEAYDKFIARLKEGSRVVESADFAEDLRLLQRGGVSAILAQPVTYQAYLSGPEMKNSVTIRDWAPKDQFSVGALILSRKSFTSAQAKNWDALLVQFLKDGTMLTMNQTFLPAAQARALQYTGKRSAE